MTLRELRDIINNDLNQELLDLPVCWLCDEEHVEIGEIRLVVNPAAKAFETVWQVL